MKKNKTSKRSWIYFSKVTTVQKSQASLTEGIPRASVSIRDDSSMHITLTGIRSRGETLISMILTLCTPRHVCVLSEK